MEEIDNTIPIDFEEIQAIMRRVDTENPEEADIEVLRLKLKEYPNLWRLAGDLANRAALHIVDELKAVSSVRESLESGVAALKDELGYWEAPLAEKLLIEQVVLCWLRHNLLEYRYGSISGGNADYLDRRLSASQRRFLRACETLARVRRLTGRPAVQVNIATKGGQQVNVAGDMNVSRKADPDVRGVEQELPEG